MTATFDPALEAHEFAYLTTTGRVTGDPHRIEIWFGVLDGSVWMIAGGRRESDWIRNLEANPSATLEIGDDRWTVTPTFHPPADHPARPHLAERYAGDGPPSRLVGWSRAGLLVSFDPVPQDSTPA